MRSRGLPAGGVGVVAATRIPEPDAPREELVARSLEMLPNTAPFDVSGYPAMNVPYGLSEELPVGMMLVGKTRPAPRQSLDLEPRLTPPKR